MYYSFLIFLLSYMIMGIGTILLPNSITLVIKQYGDPSDQICSDTMYRKKKFRTSLLMGILYGAILALIQWLSWYSYSSYSISHHTASIFSSLIVWIYIGFFISGMLIFEVEDRLISRLWPHIGIAILFSIGLLIRWLI